MKHLLNILLLFCLLMATSAGAQAQPTTSEQDAVYGLDPLLYNGKFYTYHVPPRTKGNPYLHGNEFVRGSALVRGILFDGLEMKFDVFNQQFIVRYQKEGEGDQNIVLAETWLEAVDLENLHFKLVAVNDTVKQIFQVMEAGSTAVYYKWNKELKLDTRPGHRNYVFSEPKKDGFVKKEHELLKYNSNKSFLSSFDVSIQAALKKYLKQNRIKVTKISDQAMLNLIRYINTLKAG